MIPINVIHAPNVDTFDYLLFPEQHQNNQHYVQQQFQQFSQTLTDVGRKFMEGARDVFQRVCESDTARLARAAIRAAKGIFHPNHIMPLQNLDAFQSAQPVMQRYIMAQIDIRQMYHDNRCDGYSDSYVDLYPSKVGVDHYDYRRATNHMVQECVVDGKASWSVTAYAEDLVEGDRELGFDEKVCIQKTWDLVRMFVEAGNDDPTNSWGGKLG